MQANSGNKSETIPFFFIIGRARSGTTLLRMFFDAHPNICIPLESPVILHLFPKYGKIRKWDEVLKTSFCDDLYLVKDFDKWKTNRDQVLASLINQKRETDFQNLIRQVYLNYQSVFEKKDIILIGDKNPVYSVNAFDIFNIFPDAKYIHLTRDYRDHILSMVSSKLLTPVVLFLAYRWKQSAKEMIRLKRKHSSQFYTIRYEDLVSNPGKYMIEMCSFLGIVYDPGMIHYHSKMEPNIRENLSGMVENHHKKVFEPVSTDRIGVWKTGMNDRDVRIADLVVGKYAGISGYERKYPQFDILLYCRLIPGLVWERLSYSIKKMTTRIPYRTKTRMRTMFPRLAAAISKTGK